MDNGYAKIFSSIIFLSLLATNTFAQDIPKVDRGLVKLSAFPFLYKELFAQNTFWLAAYYEKAFSTDSRNTYSMAVEYLNYTSSVTVNGNTVSSFPDNIDIWIRPQFRHYFSTEPYKGYYVGLYPVYLYSNHPGDPSKGNHFGLGFSTGYQFIVKGRFTIDFNLRISDQVGQTSTVDINQQPVTKTETKVSGGFEINVGFRLKARK